MRFPVLVVNSLDLTLGRLMAMLFEMRMIRYVWLWIWERQIRLNVNGKEQEIAYHNIEKEKISNIDYLYR